MYPPPSLLLFPPPLHASRLKEEEKGHLQQHGKAQGGRTQHTHSSKRLTHSQGPHSDILDSRTLAIRRLSHQTRIHRHGAAIRLGRDSGRPIRGLGVTCTCRAHRSRHGGRGHHGRGQGTRILAGWILGSARVILATVAGTFGVGAAVGDTLCAPLGADGVGERIAILGDVGRDAVVADAGVGETFGVAFVG